MEIIITIRKKVADSDAGQAIYEIVKQKLADHPEVTMTAHVSNHFPRKEPT